MEDWGKGSGLVRSPPPVLYGSGTRLRLNRQQEQTNVRERVLFVPPSTLIDQRLRTSPNPNRALQFTGHFNRRCDRLPPPDAIPTGRGLRQWIG